MDNTHQPRRLLPFFLLATMLFQNIAFAQGSTRERLDKQTNDFQLTVVGGAIAGAVAGGLLGGKVSADKDKNKGRLAGALIGAIGGALLGQKVADRKQAFVNSEESLNSMIANATQRNTQLEQIVLTARTLLEEDRAMVSQLAVRIDDATRSAAIANQTLAQLSGNRDSIGKAIDAAKNQRAAIEKEVKDHENTFPESVTNDELQVLIASYSANEGTLKTVQSNYDDLISGIADRL